MHPRTRSFPVAAMLAAVISGVVPSQANGTPVIVSGPGDTFKTFTQPVAAAQPGDEVVFVHLDPTGIHDVVTTTQYGPDDAAHCFQRTVPFPPLGGVFDPSAATFTLDGEGNRVRAFPVGKCPMIYTQKITVGQRYPLEGLDNIVPGTIYDFKCTLHPSMFGRLIALPA